MKPLSEITAFIADCGGLNCELALLLAKTYKRVLYFTPNDEAYTTHNRSIIGKGYPEIELADNIDQDEDEVDLYITPDVGLGPAAWHKRFKDRKKVWGSLYGEELEMDRVATKELMKSLGIAVGPYEVIEGRDDLITYLKDFKNGYVKTSWYRGEFESRRWKDWTNSHKWIERILWQLGTEADDYMFIVEECLPKDPGEADKWVELGQDMYIIDGQSPSRHLCGIEIKDCGYVGVFKDRLDFPKEITELTDKLAPKFREVGYRGDWSDEQRFGPDGISHPIDMTCRRPSPPGEATMNFYSNMAEIIAKGAEGILVDPIPMGKCVVQIVIKSEGHSIDAEQTITFPEEYRDNIKLHCARRQGPGEYEIIPQNFELVEVGGVTGWGNNFKEAHDMVEEIAGTISGTYVSVDTDVLDQAERELEKAASIGLDIT